MSVVNDAINSVLEGHQPFPAVVVDRRWELVAGNAAVGVLTEGSAAHLLEPPANVLRLSLHPEGMAPRIANLGRMAGAHPAPACPSGAGDRRRLLGRVARASLPVIREAPATREKRAEAAAIVVPLRYRTPHGELSFFSTTTVFGTPLDVTVAELAIEAFYPAEPPPPRCSDALRAENGGRLARCTHA